MSTNLSSLVIPTTQLTNLLSNVVNSTRVNSTSSSTPQRSWVRSCITRNCRLVEKLDFMDFNPERSAADFYRDYDPMVGIGTALILLSLIFLITIKSLVHYAIRHIRQARYRKKFFAAAAAAAAKKEETSRKNRQHLQRIYKSGRSQSTSSNLIRYNYSTKSGPNISRRSLRMESLENLNEESDSIPLKHENNRSNGNSIDADSNNSNVIEVDCIKSHDKSIDDD